MGTRRPRPSSSVLGELLLVGVVVLLAVVVAVGAFSTQHRLGVVEELAVPFLKAAFGG